MELEATTGHTRVAPQRRFIAGTIVAAFVVLALVCFFRLLVSHDDHSPSIKTVRGGTSLAQTQQTIIVAEATQSSVWSHHGHGDHEEAVDAFGPNRAVDGDPICPDGVGASRTQKELGPWWHADLGNTMHITSLEVWPSCLPETGQTFDFHVDLSNSPFDGGEGEGHWKGEFKSTDLEYISSTTAHAVFNMADDEEQAVARYVRIKIEQNAVMCLCEVVVTGTEFADPCVEYISQCDENALCGISDSNVDPECTCLSGYEGDGQHCEPLGHDSAENAVVISFSGVTRALLESDAYKNTPTPNLDKLLQSTYDVATGPNFGKKALWAAAMTGQVEEESGATSPEWYRTHNCANMINYFNEECLRCGPCLEAEAWLSEEEPGDSITDRIYDLCAGFPGQEVDFCSDYGVSPVWLGSYFLKAGSLDGICEQLGLCTGALNLQPRMGPVSTFFEVVEANNPSTETVAISHHWSGLFDITGNSVDRAVYYDFKIQKTLSSVLVDTLGDIRRDFALWLHLDFFEEYAGIEDGILPEVDAVVGTLFQLLDHRNDLSTTFVAALFADAESNAAFASFMGPKVASDPQVEHVAIADIGPTAAFALGSKFDNNRVSRPLIDLWYAHDGKYLPNLQFAEHRFSAPTERPKQPWYRSAKAHHIVIIAVSQLDLSSASEEHTPTMWRMMQNGWHSTARGLFGSPSDNIAALLHGQVSITEDKDCPTLFDVADAQMPDLKTAAFASNQDVIDALGPGVDMPFLLQDAAGIVKNVTEHLDEHQPNLSFVEFSQLDAVADQYGAWSHEYFMALVQVDKHMEFIWNAIEQTGIHPRTSVIVVGTPTSDSVERGDVRVPLIIDGEATKPRVEDSADRFLSDASSTALYLLGLWQPRCWRSEPITDAIWG